jgi:hypothetical protein
MFPPGTTHSSAALRPQNDSGTEKHRFSINQVTKLTVAPQLQLLALTEPVGAQPHGKRPGEPCRRGLRRSAGRSPCGGRTAATHLSKLYLPPLFRLRDRHRHLSSRNAASGERRPLRLSLRSAWNCERAGRWRITPRSVRRDIFALAPRAAIPVSREIGHFSQPLTSSNVTGNLRAASSNSEESCRRRRVRSRPNRNLHPVGRIRWIYSSLLPHRL